MTSRRNKFKAIRITEGGFTFDSKREHARWCELVLLQKAKVISDLVVHPVYTLRAFDIEICKMVPDFEYVENGQWIVEDVESEPTIAPSF